MSPDHFLSHGGIPNFFENAKTKKKKWDNFQLWEFKKNRPDAVMFALLNILAIWRLLRTA